MTPREEVQKTMERSGGLDWFGTEGYEFGRYWHFVQYYERGQQPADNISLILKNFLEGSEDNLNGAWLTWKLNGGSDGRHPEDFEARVQAVPPPVKNR